MPVFNVSLQFDNKGAVTAVNAFNQVSRAADSAGKSVDGATAKMRTHGAAIKETTANVKQLAAQVVGLVAAYKTLDAAKGFVQRGIEFASSLEDAQTSIGSIIAATNKISTEQGKTLEGADAFGASLEISRDLMDEIQVLALESTATFDQLVQGVSGIIAPATKAGVAIEKLPKFTVTAAQAMSTMKIPLEQMRTEIEALLSGNINKAQDILATNLGITGEMVRNWKAQGILVDQLMAKLEPFALAGERVANSWSGLKSNMADALDYLGKVTGEGLFEDLKQSYRELLDLIISTDTGKPGISADFENVAGLIRDIQDAIGEGILDLTRDLIDELKELNKPENIAEVKRAFAEFKDVAVELFDTVTKVTSAITSFVATSMQGWSNMPDIIQEMGIVGAVLLGKKGKLALLAVGQMDNFVRGLMATASGEMSFSEFAALPGGEEGRKILDALEGKGGGTKAPAMAVSHGGGEVTPSKPAPSGPYKTTAAISDAPKKVSASATNARQKIEELRREIEVLNGESSKAGVNLANKLDDIAKAGKAAGLSVAEVGALQQEYKDAFQAKALDDFNKALLQAQGNTSALKEIQIGETLRDWQQQFEAVGLTAEQYAPKIEGLQNALKEQQEFKDLKVAADFYKELADLSGSYGKSLALQNRLIKEQAKNWERAGIPLEDISERVRLMVLDLSQDPFDGAYRGLLKFSAEYADSGKQWENVTYSFARDFNDATRDMFDTFLDTGRVSFASLEQSFYQLLKNMAYQALVQPVVLSIVGGVQQSVYGMTTAGRGGVGMGGLTSLPVSSLLPESVTSGISGITGTVLPGTRVAGLMGPTTSGAALSGGLTIGSALGYGAFGGLGYSLLGGALGLPQNSYTGITSSLGGSLGAWGGAALGSTGALAGSIIGSALPFVGTALGALAGGLLGGLFGGGGDKDPWVNVTTQLDLLGQITNRDPWTDRAYRVEGQGWESTSNQGEGISYETGKQLADMAAELAKQALKDVTTFQESVAAIGNSALEEQFNAALEQNRFLSFRYEWEDREIKPEEMTEAFNKAIQEKLYLSLSAVDVTSLATAADGALADTMPEATKAITDAMSFVALGANLGEYQDDFNAAISGKLLDALNQMDTSGIALDVDKSSLAGWEAAAKALQGWQEVTDALDEILEPTSELESSLQAATTQFDAWIDRLEDLGWQESAIAEIEARRAQYMNEYASALTRATEQDLYLRSLALQYGDDSLEYGLQSLQYQQQNELAELAKKFGKDSAIYNQAVETQQAELLAYQIQYWQSYLQQEISSQQQVVDALDKLVDVLEDARADLWASDRNLMGTRYDEALVQFDAAYQKAMSGDQEAIAQLPTLAGSLLALGKDNLATSQEYTDLFYDVDRKLKLAQEQAVKQVDAAQAQLDALNAMLEQGDEQQLTLEEISAKLSELMERYQQELADITGGGSLSQREALIQAKVDQLNAIAQGGRTDWTAESFLSYMYGEGLTLQSWYDRFGQYENLGVGYDSEAAYRAILENKAAMMNAGLTLAPGQEAGGWTAEKVLAQIKKDGMTIDEWYLRYGLQEGVGEYYKQYSQEAANSTNHTIENMEKSLSGSLSGINSSINGLDWNVVVNVSGGSYGGNSTSNTTSSDTVSSNNTTVSGTVSGGWSSILQEKADALNRGETLASGQTAGGWTADKVLEAIHDEGMTVQEWYDRHGKIEGFASGGITPANRPFWVGEDGPELMMSPNQYGVLSNRTSMSLLNQPIDSDSIVTAIRNSGRDIYVVLRQLLTKTDAIYGQQRRILQRLDMWDAEGLPS